MLFMGVQTRMKSMLKLRKGKKEVQYEKMKKIYDHKNNVQCKSKLQKEKNRMKSLAGILQKSYLDKNVKKVDCLSCQKPLKKYIS